MISFIILFFPTFISLYIINKRNNLNNKELIILYPMYNALINAIAMFATYIFKKGQIIIISDNFNVLNFCVKYLVITIIIAVIIPYTIEFIKKNIKVELEIRRDKKNDEKSN